MAWLWRHIDVRRFGVPDRAYQFDGSDDYIDCGQPSRPRFHGTIHDFGLDQSSQLDGYGSKYRTIVGKWKDWNPGDVDLRQYTFGFGHGGYVHLGIGAGGPWDAVISAEPLMIGVWTHIAGIYDGSSLKVYVNGVEQGSKSTSLAMVSQPVPVQMAAANCGGWGQEFFQGALSEVRMYNRALASNEIWQIYNLMTRGIRRRGSRISRRASMKIPSWISRWLGFDADGDELTYSIVDSPSHGEVLLDGDMATYLPDANYYGSDTFTYRANDGTLDSNVGTVTLQIANVNDAPILEPIEDQVVDEGQLLEFSIMGVDVDGDELSYSMEGLPAGAQFDPVTHTFRWTPTYQQAGEYALNCVGRGWAGRSSNGDDSDPGAEC